MTAAELPAELRRWVESVVRAPVTLAAPHLAGASRQAWTIDAAEQRLFLLRDSVGGGGSGRDAAVLQALRQTPVPVPAVVGYDAGLGAVLLERVEGRSDFPPEDAPSEIEPTAAHLMEVTAALHRLDPAQLALGEQSRPGAAGAAAMVANVGKLVSSLEGGGETLLSFATQWLGDHLPAPPERLSLVHSDMGPGNFLFQGGRVTAVLDWEVAHLGDAMEDLAAISIRDMATPVGDLGKRFAEYAAAAGVAVDMDRVAFFRVLILTRNTALLSHALQQPGPGLDVAQLLAYRTLLYRAAALALCDCVGVERPQAVELTPGPPTAVSRSAAVAAAHLVDTVVPTLGDPVAASRAAGAAGLLGCLVAAETLSPVLTAAEEQDRAGLPAAPPDRVMVAYLARRALRHAALTQPLMGPLADRLPQPLPW